MYAALIFLLCTQVEAKPELSIPQLIQILRAEPRDLTQESGKRAVRHSSGLDAAIQLRRLGESAIKPLAEQLQDPAKIVRQNTLWVLGLIGTLPAQRAILPALDDKEPAVRVAAVNGLRALEENDIRAALLARLQDEAPEVRRATVQQLYLPDVSYAKKEKPKLSNLQINEVTKALSLRLKDEDDNVRIITPRTLASYHSGNELPALSAAAKDKNAEVRREVADALGEIGNRRALPTLNQLLDDRDGAVVLQAIGAHGKLADPRSTEKLLHFLKSPQLNQQVVAARALGAIGDRRAVEPLSALLQTKDESMIDAVSEALGKLGDPRAVEPLIDALKEHPRRCGRIITALGELNDPRAIDPILAAIFQDDPQKRDNSAEEAAEKALPRIKHPDVLRLAAKYALADKKAHASFLMRRMVENMVDRDFRFDAAGFEQWAKEEYPELK